MYSIQQSEADFSPSDLKTEFHKQVSNVNDNIFWKLNLLHLNCSCLEKQQMMKKESAFTSPIDILSKKFQIFIIMAALKLRLNFIYPHTCK